jgi:hypothetical protein
VIVDGKNIYPKLMLPHGFYAYQWEKDGVILSESAHEIEAKEPGVYRARFRRTPNTVDDRWNRWSAPVRITTGSMPSGSDKIINDAKAYNRVPDKGKSEPVNLGQKESENHQSAHTLLKESAGL